MYRKCRGCAGSGKVMGGGMVPWDCELCDGTGKKYDAEHAKRRAVEEIQARTGLSYEKSQQLFDEESERIDMEKSDEKNKDTKARKKEK